MSALTKVFVVLHVVVSLLLAAGLIVFVNRQDNHRVAAEASNKKLAVALQEGKVKDQEILKVKSEIQAVSVDKDNQIKLVEARIAELQATINTDAVTLATANQNLIQAQAAVTSLTAALGVAQADIAARQTAFNELRTAYDRVNSQSNDQNNRISELTNALEVVTKHDRFMAEQNTQFQQQIAQLNEVLHKYNISPNGTNPPVGGAVNAAPIVNINGIVRETRQVQGVPYATISLGSAEAVTKGMQFTVVDPQQNKFLGYLVVDTVDAHEATGHMTGPAVNQVKPNITEVRTQP